MQPTPRSGRNDDGSIVLTILVVVVASALVLALVSLAESNLRQSRRAGDSANALQVADAGISDAVASASAFEAATRPTSPQALPAGSPYTCTSTPRRCTGTITVAGSEASVEAVREPALNNGVWHIVSTGTDAVSQQRRRARADAVPTSGPSIALFVSANMSLNAGTEVDSFRGPVAPNTCTGNGFIGTNDAASMNLGNPTGTSGNCRGTSWGYYYDGCVSYADVNPGDFTAASGCPPAPARKKITPAFVLDNVYPLAQPLIPQPGGPCTATNPIAGGQIHYWESVQLWNGCRIQPDALGNHQVKIVTMGDVQLGQGGGGGAIINSPSANATCIAQGGNVKYCAGWAGNLQISVVSRDPGTVVNVANNNVQFWGTINAPTAKLTACNGCPQSELWGSFIFAEASAPVQLKLHYDEALAGSGGARYERRNWVQEAA